MNLKKTGWFNRMGVLYQNYKYKIEIDISKFIVKFRYF